MKLHTIKIPSRKRLELVDNEKIRLKTPLGDDKEREEYELGKHRQEIRKRKNFVRTFPKTLDLEFLASNCDRIRPEKINYISNNMISEKNNKPVNVDYSGKERSGRDMKVEVVICDNRPQGLDMVKRTENKGVGKITIRDSSSDFYGELDQIERGASSERIQRIGLKRVVNNVVDSSDYKDSNVRYTVYVKDHVDDNEKEKIFMVYNIEWEGGKVVNEVEYLVGRSSESQIKLNSKRVSNKHAKIIVSAEGNKIEIKALKTKNGVSVDNFSNRIKDKERVQFEKPTRLWIADVEMYIEVRNSSNKCVDNFPSWVEEVKQKNRTESRISVNVENSGTNDISSNDISYVECADDIDVNIIHGTPCEIGIQQQENCINIGCKNSSVQSSGDMVEDCGNLNNNVGVHMNEMQMNELRNTHIEIQKSLKRIKLEQMSYRAPFENVALKIGSTHNTDEKTRSFGDCGGDKDKVKTGGMLNIHDTEIVVVNCRNIKINSPSNNDRRMDVENEADPILDGEGVDRCFPQVEPIEVNSYKTRITTVDFGEILQFDTQRWDHEKDTQATIYSSYDEQAEQLSGQYGDDSRNYFDNANEFSQLKPEVSMVLDGSIVDYSLGESENEYSEEERENKEDQKEEDEKEVDKKEVDKKEVDEKEVDEKEVDERKVKQEKEEESDCNYLNETVFSEEISSRLSTHLCNNPIAQKEQEYKDIVPVQNKVNTGNHTELYNKFVNSLDFAEHYNCHPDNVTSTKKPYDDSFRKKVHRNHSLSCILDNSSVLPTPPNTHICESFNSFYYLNYLENYIKIQTLNPEIIPSLPPTNGNAIIDIDNNIFDSSPIAKDVVLSQVHSSQHTSQTPLPSSPSICENTQSPITNSRSTNIHTEDPSSSLPTSSSPPPPSTPNADTTNGISTTPSIIRIPNYSFSSNPATNTSSKPTPLPLQRSIGLNRRALRAKSSSLTAAPPNSITSSNSGIASTLSKLPPISSAISRLLGTSPSSSNPSTSFPNSIMASITPSNQALHPYSSGPKRRSFGPIGLSSIKKKSNSCSSSVNITTTANTTTPKNPIQKQAPASTSHSVLIDIVVKSPQKHASANHSKPLPVPPIPKPRYPRSVRNKY
ncbi:hypothetical protein AX774_g2759 [Zancudomyces culisetae]|uniref:FHA domain-containing protein n=1 Tax=Zancudomyces culisetae TaxID=1213189 RepID=A0A1R1PS15_ZANCU|nr:hypothetical protein AX774_g2759 [Zancudomyces culisetae]|eukprot:OMH83744.1 hypothetical protein AX774_g2759 [Zancudomyces culisetae]